MYKLCFFVPETHLETVKAAVFEAGAGRIGDYDQCCWQVKGEGQFRPLSGSQPFLGTQGALENVAEYRVEMVMEQSCAKTVLKALKELHPYEEPAYDVMALVEGL
ncbi:Nif3-like dinuclear metal center hexameric protein [Hydrogenovibrio thermophilus]|uniref:NGG1p interacting factor NIF3 n=1 Tax=Hydrogenovibrio thermophilus TaxID=265883 RepID=A0A410H229_9GAMM|nr:YqfO family protein [Hydrogenovibrio thermophilus]QAB14946.1 NGG1p interacting factor NIF3 [Hydrogenovibrio thermophilus]